MKCKLISILIVFAFASSLPAQVNRIYPDSIYQNIIDYNFEKFKIINIPGFKFTNSCIDMNLRFRPNNDLSLFFGFNDFKIRGKVKQITKFNKFKFNKEKKFDKTIFFNSLGLPSYINDYLGNHEYYYYDTSGFLIHKEILFVNKKTKNTYNYIYNENKQLTKITEIIIRDCKEKEFIYLMSYDSLKRPVKICKIDSAGEVCINTINYNNNFVTFNGIKNGVVSWKKELFYSDNNHLLAEKVNEYTNFYAYDSLGNLCKWIYFIDDKLSFAFNYSFDDYGNETLWTTYGGPNNAVGEIHKTILKFDEKGNITYRFTSNNVTSNTYEYTYEITY